MKYKPLGRSGLIVSNLCLGTMVFGEGSTRAADEATAIRMIHRFLDVGGNYIDTANLYAEGRSEEIVGKAIKNRRDQVALAWLLAQPAVDTVLIGVSTEAQLEDNLRAAEVDLTSDEITRLDEVSALEESCPYRFLKMYAVR